MLGVRLPKLREIARILAKGDWKTYLAHASDKSMEEIMLQGMTLGYARSSFQEKKPWLKRIIPKIRNWSLCDSICVSMKFPKAEAGRCLGVSAALSAKQQGIRYPFCRCYDPGSLYTAGISGKNFFPFLMK